MFEMYQSKQTSRLGMLLLKKGLISSLQLEQALTHQLTHQLRLGESLIALGFIQASCLNRILSKQRIMRSLVASVMIVASPFTSVMANELEHQELEHQKLEQNASLQQNISTSKSTYILANQEQPNFYQQIDYRPVSDFSLGIKYKISDNSGIIFGLGKASPNTIALSGIYPNALVPQISIFTSEAKKSTNLGYLNVDSKTPRFDRYKNTRPVVYNLTLKGYSLFEQSDSKTKVFQLNKVKDLNNRNFELMFSVSKHF